MTNSDKNPDKKPGKDPNKNLQAQLDLDLIELKLLEIAKSYREVLDEAARKGSSMVEVLATLIGLEQTLRQQRALERRLRSRGFPSRKPWPRTNSTSPSGCPRRPSCAYSIAISLIGTAAPC